MPGVPLIVRKLFRRRIVLAAAVVLASAWCCCVVAAGRRRRGSRARPQRDARSSSGCKARRARTGSAPTSWAATCSRASSSARATRSPSPRSPRSASVLAGTLLGLVAGFFRRLDAPLMRVVDAMMSFPDILLAIALVAHPGRLDAQRGAGAGARLHAAGGARGARLDAGACASCCSSRRRARWACRTSRILWRHILPNLVSPILVQVTFIFAYAILAEAGAVVPRRRRAAGDPHLGHDDRGQPAVRAPGAAGSCCSPGWRSSSPRCRCRLLGDGIRDLLDPRLRKTM